jgi:hypothetical protein
MEALNRIEARKKLKAKSSGVIRDLESGRPWYKRDTMRLSGALKCSVSEKKMIYEPHA